MMRPIWSPTVIGSSTSPRPTRGRRAHSTRARTRRAAPRHVAGIAPSEWLIRYVVVSRIGNSEPVGEEFAHGGRVEQQAGSARGRVQGTVPRTRHFAPILCQHAAEPGDAVPRRLPSTTWPVMPRKTTSAVRHLQVTTRSAGRCSPSGMPSIAAADEPTPRRGTRCGWTLHAWCALGTHYHAVIEAELTALSAGMQRLNGIYAQSFNERWDRSGHLFGDRFAAWIVRDENHYEHTLRYVRDNPVQAGLCADPADWPWLGPRRLLELAEPLDDAEHALAPGHAVCRACAAERLAIGQIPVIGGAERLGVRQARLPAEEGASAVDRRRTSRGGPCGSATRRAATAAGVRARATPPLPAEPVRASGATTSPACAISASRSSRTVPNRAAPTLSARPRRRPLERAHHGLDEILDGKKLVAVRAVSENRDAPALADPVEEDLEDAQALGPDERLRPHDHRLEPSTEERARKLFGRDLRLAVGADTDERIVLVEGMVDPGTPYTARRRDQDGPPHAGLEGGASSDSRAARR